MTKFTTGKIERKMEPGGWRDYLLGTAIHCGDPINMQIAPGVFIQVRYEIRGEAEIVLITPMAYITPRADAEFNWRRDDR